MGRCRTHLLESPSCVCLGVSSLPHQTGPQQSLPKLRCHEGSPSNATFTWHHPRAPDIYLISISHTVQLLGVVNGLRMPASTKASPVGHQREGPPKDLEKHNWSLWRLKLPLEHSEEELIACDGLLDSSHQQRFVTMQDTPRSGYLPVHSLPGLVFI